MAAVLVTFRGAQGYVSPNWYPGKQKTHRRVHRIEGNFKLNQHHQASDRDGVIRGLEASGNERLAKAMREAGPDASAAADRLIATESV